MIAVLSDIHGNMYAFNSVLEDMKQFDIEGIIMLGDLIDYGMQSNDVVRFIQHDLRYKIICNIWGNHERAIVLDDYTKFSSRRGVNSAFHTSKLLSKDSYSYLKTSMNPEGIQELSLCGKRCLAVHGSLDDHYWKAISADSVYGDYQDYDLVFSGHSHYSHMFTKFYDANDPDRRNKHAVLFINPGSVGQPRNHNNNAQYALICLDNMSVYMRSVSYDIDAAMSLYDGSVDLFYRDRLINGV